MLRDRNGVNTPVSVKPLKKMEFKQTLDYIVILKTPTFKINNNNSVGTLILNLLCCHLFNVDTLIIMFKRLQFGVNPY